MFTFIFLCFSSSILKSTDYLFFWNFLVFSFWIYGLWFVDLQPHGIKLVFSLICCLFLPMYLGYFPCKVWEWDAVKKHFLRRGNREERLPNYTRTELRIRDNWCYKVIRHVATIYWKRTEQNEVKGLVCALNHLPRSLEKYFWRLLKKLEESCLREFRLF